MLGLLRVLVLLVGFTSPMDSLRAGAVGGLADVFLLSAVAVLILYLVSTTRPWRLGRSSTAMVFGLLLAIFGLLGTIWSPAPTASMLNIARFTVAITGLLVLLAGTPRDYLDVRRFAWAYVAGSTISAAHSFTSFSPYNLRSSGLSFHPNALGLTSIFAITVLYGIVASGTVRERMVSTGCLIVLAGGVLNSGSRTAILAGGLSAIIFLAASNNRRMLRYAVVVASIGLLLIAVGVYELPESSALDRLFQSDLTQEADHARIEALDATIDRVAEHYVTGSGFANANAAHNLPLQVLDSAGLLGLVAFGGLVVAIVRPMLRRRRDPFVAGFLTMYLTYLVSGLAAPPMWDRWVWFPIACGLASATHSGRRPPAVAVVEPTRPLPVADHPSS